MSRPTGRGPILLTVVAVVLVLAGSSYGTWWVHNLAANTHETTVSNLELAGALLYTGVEKLEQKLLAEVRSGAVSPSFLDAIDGSAEQVSAQLHSTTGTATAAAFVTPTGESSTWPWRFKGFFDEHLLEHVSTAETASRGAHVIHPVGPPDNPFVLAVAPVVVDDQFKGALVAAYPATEFQSLFQTVQTRESLEAYAFDRDGRMLTPSRFDEDLAELGLVTETTTGAMELLLTDPETGDLTFGVASALRQQTGSSTLPYNDYRGVPVVGAWRYDPHFEIGWVVEIDAAQSAASIRAIQWAGYALIAAIGGFLLFQLINSYRGTERLATEVTEKTLELRAVIEALPDLLIHTDGDGQVIRVYAPSDKNGVAVPEHEPGANVDSLWPPRGQVHPSDIVRRAASSGSMEVVRWSESGRRRTRHFEVRAMPITGSNQVVSLVREVTGQVEQEERMLEELKEKDSFISTVSHEIRTPLTTVVGLLEVLGDSSGEVLAESADLVNLARTEANDLAEIVDDLIVLRRSKAGDLSVSPERVPLTPLVQQTVQSMSRRLTHDITFVPPEMEVVAIADQRRVRQILRNLLSNAHTHGGASITTEIEASESRAIIRVIDDGNGASPSVVGTMFERYVSGAAREGRTDSLGIGLALSRDLARRMGGDLSYSREDGHTHFVLTLPNLGTSLGSHVRT